MMMGMQEESGKVLMLFRGEEEVDLFHKFLEELIAFELFLKRFL